LATEISPLAQNENSKKKPTTYRKLSNEVLRAVSRSAFSPFMFLFQKFF